MDNCIFCKIISGEIPSQKLHQDEQVTAFRDLHPVAPTHVLIVPNQHIASVNEVTPEDEALLGHLYTVAKQLAEQDGIQEHGFRLIVNTGPYAGQEIYHLHMHLIGGQRLRFPMG
jgi:histidine triad (HIT) family protein